MMIHLDNRATTLVRLSRRMRTKVTSIRSKIRGRGGNKELGTCKLPPVRNLMTHKGKNATESY